MPKGYENAFGTFDVTKNTLFINKGKCQSVERFLFTFYHELRHAEQYLRTNKFSNDIQKSIFYVNLHLKKEEKKSIIYTRKFCFLNCQKMDL